MINHEELVARCMGNREIADRLIVKFCHKVAADMERLGTAIHDADQVGRLAHGLKGTAANVACEQIRQLAERLETLARSSDLQEAPALLSRLEQTYQKLIVDGSVAKLLERGNSGGT